MPIKNLVHMPHLMRASLSSVPAPVVYKGLNAQTLSRGRQMLNAKKTYIAGYKTTEDWNLLRQTLRPGDSPAVWAKVFRDYFEKRLSLRYLEPIKILQENGAFQGEGFSIVAIQCSLIEFLESTVQGKSYRYRRRGSPPLGQHEYSESGKLFVNFLTSRTPFSLYFKEAVAHDFYESVRCGLLHEAQTKNGWTIWAKQPGHAVINVQRQIIYRDNFQQAMLRFVEWYEGELVTDVVLQEAFIRKFDSLCV